MVSVCPPAASPASHVVVVSPSLFRDGPDTSSPQLGVFSGNTALESAYSTSPQVLIRFHSDFSTGGFFILNFHGTHTHTHMHTCGTADLIQCSIFICDILYKQATVESIYTKHILCLHDNNKIFLNDTS